MHMICHIKVHSLTISLVEFVELLIELYTPKLTMGIQLWLTHLSIYWLVSKATSLSQHLAKQGFNTWHKSTNI